MSRRSMMLRARALACWDRGPPAAVHVERIAHHQSDAFPLVIKSEQAVEGRGQFLAARDGLDRAGDQPAGVAGGDANGFGARIEAQQRPFGGQVGQGNQRHAGVCTRN